MAFSRRKMLMSSVAGAGALAAATRCSGDDRRANVRVAAVQMQYVSGDFLKNLAKVESMVGEAARQNAEWILLPEYFATGLGWAPEFVGAALPKHGLPTKLLRQLARKHKVGIAGTIVAQQNGHAFNTLILAESSGQLHFHNKDVPTGPIEAAHWIDGQESRVFATADGPMGAAICWEAIRSRTARRLLAGRVGLIFAPGAWGKASGDKDNTHQKLFDEAHVKLARMLGAPIIVANPCGTTTTVKRDWTKDIQPSLRKEFDNQPRMPIDWFGGSKIVDANGNVLASRPAVQGEGIVVHDVELGPMKPLDAVPDEFWVPKMPEFWLTRFENHRPKGRELYDQLIRPARNKF